ncbi:hypothetical protein EON63_10440 [archaeon]|nr:MAG: hypothetical protein EON63_10440 [archaeon]
MSAFNAHLNPTLGRGKTHIARRLGRYLEFFHATPVEIFNVADYRRKLCGEQHDPEWFDPHNHEAEELRESCHNAATTDMLVFLNTHENAVAIFDSTNATFKRRQQLIDKVRFNIGIHCMCGFHCIGVLGGGCMCLYVSS